MLLLSILILLSAWGMYVLAIFLAIVTTAIVVVACTNAFQHAARRGGQNVPK